MASGLTDEIVAEGFVAAFGGAPRTVACANGRVNLIGEHTDYNNGFVLPAPIPQRTFAAVASRDDGTVRIASREFPGDEVRFDAEESAPRKHWSDYVRGIVALLDRRDLNRRGFDLYLASDVPVGSGLSSSAALQIAVLRGLRMEFSLSLDDMAMSLLAQQVEHEFAGAMVGIMDPMACALGEPGFANFIDTESLAHERIALPQADLVVIHSGVAHQHAGGDYNQRRAECEAACQRLGVVSLRQLGPADLPRIEKLEMPFCQRARHVVTENKRVFEAVEAMQQGDLPTLGSLFNQSHNSQRDDYAVSVQAIDVLVECARQDPRVYGARLTGGGFGGSVVVLAELGSGGDVAAKTAAAYRKTTGHVPRVLVPE